VVDYILKAAITAGFSLLVGVLLARYQRGLAQQHRKKRKNKRRR
jgi:hypothetical protein